MLTTGSKDRLPVPRKTEKSNLHCSLSKEREESYKRKKRDTYLLS